MRIQSIELENFRQYRGKVLVELGCDQKKNINVIQGVNGAGKTNMLNAIEWCLYDKEGYLEKYSGKKQPIINDAELKELKEGEKATAKVTLRLIDSGGRQTVFERQISARRDKDGITFDGESEAHAYMRIKQDMVELTEREFTVNRILPYGVRSFFFFDGERLDEFFKEEKSSVVRDAILDVSQLSLLEKAIEHLERTISSMRGKIKGDSPKIEDIQEAIREVEGGRENYRQQKRNKEEELSGIRAQLSEIGEKLMGSNEPLVRELQRRRETLSARLKELDETLQDNETEASDRVVERGPAIYATDAIRFALQQIDVRAKKGDIPPKIRETFIRELLDKGECICGTKIRHDSVPRKRIMGLLERAKISEIYEEMVELKYALDPMLKAAGSFTKEQDRLRAEIAGLQRQKSEAQTEQREIETRLKGINVEEITNLEFTRKALEKNEDELIGQIGILGANIENATRKLQELERELAKELSRSERFKIANQRLELGGDTLTVLARAKEKLVDETRATIEKKTEDYFLNLIWKKDTYADIKIDDDYNISVINRIGSECLGTLSAGERQVLALSFLAALREVSGFDAPVVIDTPLGRISKEPRENIAELLPNFLEHTQVTLFMTDEEYTSQVRTKLAQRIGREYELIYDEERSQTQVKTLG